MSGFKVREKADYSYAERAHISSAIPKTLEHLRFVQKFEKPIDPKYFKDMARRVDRILRGPQPNWNLWFLLCEDDEGHVWTNRIEGHYWPHIPETIATCRRIYLFRSDGLFYRTYQRVYTYPKIIQVLIQELSPEARKAIWKALGSGCIRQYQS